MLRIGLTGGIASGKSAVADELRALDVPVIDADQLARQEVAPGQPALDEIVARFGEAVLDESGGLDRKAVASIVFTDERARRELERIIHPRVAIAAQRRFTELEARGEEVAVYEVPLLVEAGLAPFFDRVIVVAADLERQIERVVERDDATEEEARARLESQLPTSEKLKHAHHVIWNDGSREALRRAVRELYEELLLVARGGVSTAMGKKRKPSGPVTLVTGLPQYTTRRLVEELTRADETGRFAFLVQERSRDAVERFVARLPGDSARFQILEGDVGKMDLGLSGAELNELAAELETIHHSAAVFHLGVDPNVAERVNVHGTEEIVELAREARGLERLVFYSTLGVSGDFRGVWTEDDYDRGQQFNNHYELTKFRAEGLLRREEWLPLTVIRAPVIVGDSETGEIERFDGPYQLMLLFIALPIDLGLPLPGRASRLVSLVPVDYFARAASILATHPESQGRTLHITEPEPMTMARVFELIAMASEKKVPSGYIPARFTRALMRTPGLERFSKSPMAALDLFTADVVYASTNAQELLRESGLVCPRFPDYVENLVGFLRQKLAKEHARRGEEEVYDPLW